MAGIRVEQLDEKLSLSSTDLYLIADYDDLDANGYPTIKFIEHSTLVSEVTGGFVSKVGTPIDNQIAIWTGDGTVEGSLDLTFDGSNLELSGNLLATVFDTNVAAAGLTISGTTIAADGTDANIDITLTPKGAAGIVIGTGVPGTTTNKLYNNAGTLFWNGINLLSGGSGAFATLANITSNSPGTLATDSFVFGSDSLDDDADPNHFSRFMFRKSASTFYAGYCSDSSWNAIEGADYCAIFGEDNYSSGDWNILTGVNNTVFGNMCSVFGNQNDTSGNLNIIAGEQNVCSGNWNAVLGDWHDDIAGDNNLIGGTSHNCDGSGNIIAGTANNITQVSAQNNAIFGSNNNITVASSVCNLISGVSNAVSESYNIVGGFGNTVQGRYNIVCGANQTFSTSAWYCLVVGDTHTIGNSYQNYFGDQGSSAVPFSTIKSTTSNRQSQEVLINYDTSGFQTVNIDIVGDDIIVPANTVYSFTAEILGVQTGGVTGSPGDLWKYRIKGIIKRDGANNTTYVAAAEEKEVIIEADAAIDVVAQANDTTEALEFQVTTVANRDIRWVGEVKFLEITYA